MAVLIYAVTGGVLVVLHLAAIALYLDMRGKQNVLGAAVEALQLQTKAQAKDIVSLSRAIAAVAAGDPGNVKLTGAIPRPAAPAPSGSPAAIPPATAEPPLPTAATARRIAALDLPSLDATGDRSGVNPGDAIPDVPQVAAPSMRLPDLRSNLRPAERVAERHQGMVRDAGSAAAHCQGRECSGPIGAVCACPCPRCALRRAMLTQAQHALRAPIARMPGESRDAWEARDAAEIRARHEAEADARSRARLAPTAEPSPALPDATGERESGEGATRVWSGDETLPSVLSAHATRPIPVSLDAAELERLDAAAAERGISREEMAAQLARQGLDPANDRPAGPTMPPGGPANDRGTPTENERLDPRIARRWAEKIEAASAAGHDVKHCGSRACARLPSGAAECDCNCGPCARRTKLLADAVREVLGGK